MKYTGNLKLLKPEGHDKSGWQAFNDNSDILDKEISRKSETIHLKNIDIFSANWKLEGSNYVYVYKNESITSNTSTHVYIHLEDLYNARYIHSVAKSSAGQVKLYARLKPSVNLKCDMTLFRGLM